MSAHLRSRFLRRLLPLPITQSRRFHQVHRACSFFLAVARHPQHHLPLAEVSVPAARRSTSNISSTPALLVELRAYASTSIPNEDPHATAHTQHQTPPKTHRQHHLMSLVFRRRCFLSEGSAGCASASEPHHCLPELGQPSFVAVVPLVALPAPCPCLRNENFGHPRKRFPLRCQPPGVCCAHTLEISFVPHTARPASLQT